MSQPERRSCESPPSGTVSVVIPTRNRPESLERVLRSLARQDRRPDEVIVVDASDATTEERATIDGRGVLDVTVLRARPHLCRQRNEGVRAARSSYVLVCDDDMELSTDYVRRLAEHLDAHASEGAVTGAVRERAPNGSEGSARSMDSFARSFPTPSLRHLLFAFTFQLTVWGDVEAARGGPLLSLPLRALKSWYRRRGNTWSLAGWPLVTQVRGPAVRTATYGLGAALVRRDWLLASPYDESLGPHGIGDNYGVAIGFPVCPGIVVLPDLEVLHHRAEEGRPAPEDTYHERVLALHHFTSKSPRFPWWSTPFLVWSLLGSAALFLAQGKREFFRQAVRATGLILVGRNPLERAPRAADAESPVAIP